MTDIQAWLDKDPQRCSWCPEPAYGHAWHNDYALHPSCGKPGHGHDWAPRTWDRLPKALAALQAVIDMHHDSGDGWCNECSDGFLVNHPCPTVRAIQDAIGDKQ